MDDRAICLPLGQKFWFDTPRKNSSLQGIAENLLRFTREYRDTLVCQYYTYREDTEKSSRGGILGIAT